MIGWIIGIITTVVGSFLSALAWSLHTQNRELRKTIKEKEQEKESALCNGVKCLLRSDLIAKHKLYTERGYISPHGLESFNEAYECYTKLGGNGRIKHLKKEIDALPIKY